MKNFEAQGFTKAKAFETTGITEDLNMLKNATLAWKKAGSPMDSKVLARFVAAYIKEKKAVGAYIVVDPASDDTRLRPYNVINEVTTGKRKATTVYQIKEATFKVKSTTVTDDEGKESVEYSVPNGPIELGVVAGKATKKSEALKLMKELIELNKRDYVIEIVKEVTNGQKYAAYGKYTPSKSAKEGKFLFYVND